MTRKLTHILLTSAGVLLGASACSSTDKPIPPVKAISACDKNQVATGGYLWTFTDAGKNTYGTVDPFTIYEGEDSPNNRGFTVAKSPLPEDSSNTSCKIEGDKPIDPVSGDPQWEEKDSCEDTPRYPVAGIGFSFLDKNAKFSVCDNLGIRFRARGSFKSSADGTIGPEMEIRVGIPTIQTDLWEEGDKWAADKSGQICLCQHQLVDPTAEKSCFGFWGKTFYVTSDWQWYSMTWGEMEQPSWAAPTPFDPLNVLKTQFTIESKGGEYELELDDIQFILAAEGLDWCARQTPVELIKLDNPDFCASMVAGGEPLCTAGAPEHF